MFKYLRFAPVVALLFALCVDAGGPVGKPAARLNALLAPVENFSAHFVQRISDAEGFEIQSLQGHLQVARPGKLRWESEAPYEQLVVSNAETLWVYDADLQQVSIRPFEADVSRTPAVLFIGALTDLEDQYVVTGESQGDTEIFTLAPKEEQSLYRQIRLSFRNAAPSAMELWDSLGQQTLIELTDLVLNQAMDNAHFVFVPPPGVDVLRND